MAPIIFLFFAATFLANPSSLLAHKPHISSKISVVGGVYCDTCSTKSFSKHSYFLPDVDVHVQCKFKANSGRTAEQINFIVNRTTDKYGIYKLEIANVDGIDCVDSSGIAFLCQATLLRNSNPACKIPQLRTTTDQITVKSKQDNHCIYCLNALSYKPATINDTLCSELENNNHNFTTSLNSSKFFFPFFPPFYWPPFPFLPFPPFTYPQPPPSLPFPFPPLPPPPVIFRPPPPPAFNLGDPRTWIPHVPLLSPPPPPAFNLGDPRTWFPNYPPPSPPHWPQNSNP